jgi:hypothetical protein
VFLQQCRELVRGFGPDDGVAEAAVGSDLDSVKECCEDGMGGGVDVDPSRDA